MSRALWLSLLGAACAGEGGASTEPPEVTPFAACVAPEGGWADPGAAFDVVAAQGRGAVVEVGTGAPPDDCRLSGEDAIGPHEVDVADAWWVRVAVPAGELPAETWTVGFVLPGASLDVAVDDEVYVAATWEPAGFVPATGEVRLSDFEEVPIAYVGEELTLDALHAPGGVTLAAGATRHTERDDCGAWRWHDLDVTAGAVTGTVPAGAAAVVGPWRVHDGGLVVADDDAGAGCLDWFPGHVAVAMVRVGPLGP